MIYIHLASSGTLHTSVWLYLMEERYHLVPINPSSTTFSGPKNTTAFSSYGIETITIELKPDSVNTTDLLRLLGTH